jgi:hypothetical protein
MERKTFQENKCSLFAHAEKQATNFYESIEDDLFVDISMQEYRNLTTEAKSWLWGYKKVIEFDGAAATQPGSHKLINSIMKLYGEVRAMESQDTFTQATLLSGRPSLLTMSQELGYEIAANHGACGANNDACAALLAPDVPDLGAFKLLQWLYSPASQ